MQMEQADKLRRNMKREQQSECGVCGCSDKLLLHNVRHRGTYRRFCSDCILKAHQGHFCLICLQVYDGSPPPPHARLMCVKCPSICHLSCASSSSTTTSSSSFVCPPCSSPNFSFVNFNNKKLKVNGDTTHGNNNASNDVIDEKRIDVGSAKALVAAAKIAAMSMGKAAAVARVEAERRVKEAALAKKRAREALEKLFYLAAEETKGKSTKPRIGAEGNNGGDKSSNGLYSQHQQNNRGMAN